MRARLSVRVSASLVAGLALVLLGVACNQADAIRQQALERSRAVTFKTPDGVRLSGRLFGPDTATAGVVLAHMLPADQSSWFDFADRLGAQGYRVLTFNFRGYCPGADAGCSNGKKAPASAWQDVAGARAFLRSQGSTRLALVGASMGGTAVLVSASRDPEGVEGVATLSAPVSIGGLVAEPDVMAAITAAKLFLAGDEDLTGAAASAQGLYDESLQPKQLEIFTTADHGTDLLGGNQGERARTALEDWLSKYLPVTDGSPAP